MSQIDNQIMDNPPDSFMAPDGNKYLTIRSIVYDSWITWQDALPFDKDSRSKLTQEIYNNIVELAGRIHKLHQSLPNYKQTIDPPFEFVLWWDPEDVDPLWSHGKSCRFMIDNFSAQDVQHYNSVRRGNKLIVKPLTRRLVEVRCAS